MFSKGPPSSDNRIMLLWDDKEREVDNEKRKRLEAAGWKVGDADEFLGEHVHKYRAVWSDGSPSLVCDCQYSLNEQMIIERCNATEKLLRVARAGKSVDESTVNGIPLAAYNCTCDGLSGTICPFHELRDALKEVEHLIE